MRTGERHRITCPHCVAGYAEIVVERHDGAVQVQDFTEPRRCVLCGAFFRLQYQLRITGAPLIGDPANGKVVLHGGQ